MWGQNSCQGQMAPKPSSCDDFYFFSPVKITEGSQAELFANFNQLAILEKNNYREIVHVLCFEPLFVRQYKNKKNWNERNTTKPL